MSLTEIMSSAGLSHFAEFALLLFVFAFLVIVVRVLRPSMRDEIERNAQIPLEDDRPNAFASVKRHG
jgi:cbb3-type cytochrome oxidase subunit 3